MESRGIAGSDLSCHVVVRLPHTDAAGILFYARIFEIEEELFERWLEAGGLSLRAMLERTLAPTPVVHCEADYRLPVRVGDRLETRLEGVETGRASYELRWALDLAGRRAMDVRVRRVAVDATSGGSVDLPEPLLRWLRESESRIRARS